MPAYPMSGSDPAKPRPSALGRTLPQSDEVLPASTFETDFAELAAKFTAHSGGAFSSQLSAELALEIVFNEIVEQACLATGATGAAIVLERDGEMVCRASSGDTAPELGSRLDRASGLSGECIRTREICRCADAQADPRADIQASRRLGVRAVIVLPLLRNGDLIGVLELFSTRPGAFGERDERTLQALALRVLKNLNRAAEPIAIPVEAAVKLRPVQEPARGDGFYSADRVPAVHPLEDRSSGDRSSGDRSSGSRLPEDRIFVGGVVSQAGIETTGGRGFDFVTWALGVMVVGCAILLGVLVGQHLGWQRAAQGRGLRTSGTGQGGTAQISDVQPNQTAASPSKGMPAETSVAASAAAVPDSSPGVKASISNSIRAAASAVPAGGLRVYENGKEVFRLPASGNTVAPGAEPKPGVERASAVQPEQAVELTPAAAEGSLLHRVEPEYPEQARKQQMEGPVALDVRIGADGAVQEIKLLSGSPLLAQAATDAVKQWRFKPRTVGGRQVEMQTKVTLNFRLPH
jgi:TonB family protein